MRSVSRLADVSINTVSKLLVDAGRFCAGYHDANVRDVKAANHWAVESALLQLTAYGAAQVAHAAGRAIEFAKCGEPWRPANVEEDIDALIAAQKALAH